MSLSFLQIVKNTFGLMDLFFKLTKLIFLSHMIWTMNMDQKRFKETHISLQFINLNAQLSNGEKTLKLET